jgi:hypothetical protein
MTAVAACRACGTEPVEHARFCHGCGSPVSDADYPRGVVEQWAHAIVPAIGALSSTGNVTGWLVNSRYSSPGGVCPGRAQCGRIQNCWAVARLAAES